MDPNPDSVALDRTNKAHYPLQSSCAIFFCAAPIPKTEAKGGGLNESGKANGQRPRRLNNQESKAEAEGRAPE